MPLTNRSRLVLHAIDYRATKPGSFIACLQRLTEELSRRGIRSLVVAPQSSEEQPWAQAFARRGVEVLRTHSYAEGSGIFKAHRPGIVHLHFSGYVAPLTLAAFSTHSRVIWHMHSAMVAPASRLKQLQRMLKFRVMARRANAVLAVSRPLRDQLVRLGTSPARTAVVQNGIDTQHFREPTREEKAAARTSLGIWEGERVLLFFGRDRHIKGADLLALALQHIEDPPTVLCVDSPNDVVALLSQRTRVISTGVVQDVRPLHWAADLLAMPSRYEGAAALTLLEARATGLPAVVSAIPAFNEFSDSGVVVADHLNARSFGAALAMPRPRETMAERARFRISLDAWCGAVLQHYDLG